MSKIIHQIAISDLLPKDYVAPNNESIAKNFKGYHHILWDYKKIKSFILKNKDGYVLDAIDYVNANAFKADIARYYIVYKLGGWYSDLNNFFVSTPPEEDHELVFFRDVQHLTGTSWAVQCSIFYASKNHPVMKMVLEKCVDNINQQYYGGHALCPTGPNLFGSIIASINLPEKNTYLIGNFKKNKTPGFYIEKNLFATYKSNGLKPCESGIPGNNSYEELWLSRNLYS